MFRKKTKESKAKLEHKLYLARETPEPIFDISDCNLDCIPSGVFTLCRVFRKETLCLNHNKLKSLDSGGPLKDLHLLKVLHIDYNLLECLPVDLNALACLTELYANNNCIRELPKEICDLSNLEILNVSNNRLKILPEQMDELVNLKCLSIVANVNLTTLPRSLSKLLKLECVYLDADNFCYPPKEVVKKGTASILAYMRKDSGFQDIKSNLQNVPQLPNSTATIDTIDTALVATFLDYDRKKHERMQAIVDMERQNKMLLEQEIQLAAATKSDRKQLLDDIKQNQLDLEKQVVQIQTDREINHNRLLNQLKDIEQLTDTSISKLLTEGKAMQNEFLEFERHENADDLHRLIAYSDSDRSKLLISMEQLLNQEIELVRKYADQRLETTRTVLNDELNANERLAALLCNQSTTRDNLVNVVRQDVDCQRCAVASLLEKADARNWSLIQQMQLIEQQLAALTALELQRKHLQMNEQLVDLSERRLRLAVILENLYDQQQTRRQELRKTLQDWQQCSEMDEHFWLKQYQRLLLRFPDGLSAAQKNLNPSLIQALLDNDVIKYLPFLAKLAQHNDTLKMVTDEELQLAGISSHEDRQKIMTATTNADLRSQGGASPSAPPASPCKATPTCPSGEHYAGYTECVICMDAQCIIVFAPCGHLCCCNQCSNNVIECPMCRTKIDHKIRMINC